MMKIAEMIQSPLTDIQRGKGILKIFAESKTKNAKPSSPNATTKHESGPVFSTLFHQFEN
jgi:hypothetical protein